jgi:hypothetical protein
VIPEASALVRAGRTAFSPTQVHRDRVLSALRERLGDAMLDAPPHDASMGAKGARRFGRLGWLRWPLVGIPAFGLGVALMMVGLSYWTIKPSIPTVAAPLVAVAAAPPEVAPSEAAPALPESSARSAPPPEDRAPSPPIAGAVRPRGPSRVDGLSEEVRLLSNAERDLSHGRAEDALRALTEHERRFPTGALAEERLAARVQALCLGGRRNEGRVYLTQLAQGYPRSPHLKRAQAACGVEADSGH